MALWVHELNAPRTRRKTDSYWLTASLDGESKASCVMANRSWNGQVLLNDEGAAGHDAIAVTQSRHVVNRLATWVVVATAYIHLKSRYSKVPRYKVKKIRLAMCNESPAVIALTLIGGSSNRNSLRSITVIGIVAHANRHRAAPVMTSSYGSARLQMASPHRRQARDANCNKLQRTRTVLPDDSADIRAWYFSLGAMPNRNSTLANHLQCRFRRPMTLPYRVPTTRTIIISRTNADPHTRKTNDRAPVGVRRRIATAWPMASNASCASNDGGGGPVRSTAIRTGSRRLANCRLPPQLKQ